MSTIGTKVGARLKAAAGFKIRDFELEVKAVGDDGSFSGYGSVFGVVDDYNEIVVRGAFVESLEAQASKGRKFPALWQHRSAEPVGVYPVMREDEKGLYLEGTLLTADVARAKEAHALLKAGAVTGLSIGYMTRESSFDEKTGIRTLKKLDLLEVSLVTFPANDDARVDVVKAKMARGGLPTEREFEAFLRDAGIPKSKAAAIASRGLAPLLRRDSENDGGEELKPVLDALKGLELPSLNF